MNRQQIEAALDAGKLEGLMSTGKWWRVRRNGKTRTWKRDLSRFEIPVKAGLRCYYTIDEGSDMTNFRVVACGE